jgi:hypothetical protein
MRTTLHVDFAAAQSQVMRDVQLEDRWPVRAGARQALQQRAANERFAIGREASAARKRAWS